MKKLTGWLPALMFLCIPGIAGADTLIMEANDYEGQVIASTPVNNNTRLFLASQGIDVYNGETLKTTFNYEGLSYITFRLTDNAGVKDMVVSKLRLQENPVRESLNFIGYEGDATSLTVFDASGKIVVKNDSWRGEPINVSRLSPGIYFTVINNTTFKIIKK